MRRMYLIAECLKKANCTQNKLAEFENAKCKSSVEASFSSSFHANAIVALDGSKDVWPYRCQSDGHLMPRAPSGDSDRSCVSSSLPSILQIAKLEIQFMLSHNMTITILHLSLVLRIVPAVALLFGSYQCK